MREDLDKNIPLQVWVWVWGLGLLVSPNPMDEGHGRRLLIRESCGLLFLENGKVSSFFRTNHRSRPCKVDCGEYYCNDYCNYERKSNSRAPSFRKVRFYDPTRTMNGNDTMSRPTTKENSGGKIKEELRLNPERNTE